MYCLRWWIPLFLLPFPKTSPLFLILFLFSFALHSQPCMYCALILTGLFGTSSNWYSVNSVIADLRPDNSTSTSNSTGLRASYGWLDFGLNGGNGIFSPLLRPSDLNTSKVEGSDFYTLSIPWSEKKVEVPKRFYVGLGKHQGLGVWVDLGSGIKRSSASQDEPTTSSDSAPPPETESTPHHTEL